ncbi:MAG: Fe-S cluster assembly protein SufD [Pelagibacteraceae bacterium]|nr:Fe-S cluster assembly protein SufD [Pelagibacteraceae bacterium]
MILNFDEFQRANQTGGELDDIRIKNFNIFQKKGFPSKKEESWKYADLKTILYNNLNKLEVLNNKKTSQYHGEWLLKNFQHNQIILVNGEFISSTFSFEAKDRIKIKPLRVVLKDKKNFEKIKEFFDDQKNSLTSLNHALVHDGIFLEIEDNYSFNKPLVIYNFFNKSSENKIINNKCFISLGKNSKLDVLECYKAENSIKYFNNTIHHYSIQENAILKKFSININLDNSYNYHLTNVKSYSNSIFENFLLSSGSSFLKNEIHCNLLGSYASCFVNGLILLNNEQHHELKTNVNHRYEHCKSSQLVKSVLLDKSSGTYQGKIYVEKEAQKTDGYQLSRALIFSENSTFNSKPELEIYADEVKCSHGSTTANIDQGSIFYLMSRGLSKKQANKMLIEGFLNEAVETITDLNIKSFISKLLIKKINEIKFETNEH